MHTSAPPHYHDLVLLRPSDVRSRFEHRLFTVLLLRTRVYVFVCLCVHAFASGRACVHVHTVCGHTRTHTYIRTCRYTG